MSEKKWLVIVNPNAVAGCYHRRWAVRPDNHPENAQAGGDPEPSITLQRKDQIPSCVQSFPGKNITVDSLCSVYLETDGESLGHTPFEFEIIPRSVRIITGNT